MIPSGLKFAPATLISLAAIVGAQGILSADDWPQYNGPLSNRVSAESLVVPLGEAPAWIEQWKIDTSTGFSSFVVADGMAFTLVKRKIDEEDREVCLAISTDTGEDLWSQPLAPAKYDGGGDSGAPDNRGGDGPRSTPSFSDGKVYVLDAQLGLHCFDAGSGRPIWYNDVADKYAGRLVYWQNAASPLVKDNAIYLAGGGKGQSLLAFDKETGELLWKGQSDEMTHVTPIAATIHGAHQIIYFTQSGLVAVAPNNGKLIWRQDFPHATSTAASPVVYKDIVYCSAGYGVGAGAYRIKKDDNGFESEELWRTPNELMNHWSTPVCKHGFLYGLFGFKKYGKAPLQCVDIATGKVQWSTKGFGAGNCILVGKLIVALSDRGEVVLVEARPDQYVEIYRADVLDGKCWSSPSFSDGRVYVRSTLQGACLNLTMGP